jgi:hypothetical protein
MVNPSSSESSPSPIRERRVPRSSLPSSATRDSGLLDDNPLFRGEPQIGDSRTGEFRRSSSLQRSAAAADAKPALSRDDGSEPVPLHLEGPPRARGQWPGSRQHWCAKGTGLTLSFIYPSGLARDDAAFDLQPA